MKVRELIDLLLSEDQDDEVRGLLGDGTITEITDVGSDRQGVWLDMEESD